jgi:hypothetical protein
MIATLVGYLGHLERGSALVQSATLVQRVLLFASVALGIALRLVHYVGNRAPWTDELLLLQSLYTRSFSGLLSNLDSAQMAPLGWLWAVKACIEFGGHNMFAARFVALVCGMTAFLLFARICWVRLPISAAVFAIYAFAVFEPLIYFSAEVKQYGTDLLVAVGALALFFCLRGRDSWGFRHYIFLAGFGVVTVWLSHPAPVLLAALGVTLLVDRLKIMKRRDLLVLLLIGVFWMLSFAATFYLALSDTAVMAVKRELAFPGRYMPLLPKSEADIFWYYEAVGWLFESVGFVLTGLAAIFFLAGFTSCWQTDRLLSIALVLPLLLILLISAAHLYPFWHRLLLFLAPALLMLTALGVHAAITSAPRLRLAIRLSALLLLAMPSAQSFGHALQSPPYGREEVRSLHEALANDMLPDDAVFVSFSASLYWRVYMADDPKFANITVVHGPNPSKLTITQHAQAMKPLRAHRRIWAFMVPSKVVNWSWNGVPEDRAFDLFANDIGGVLLRDMRTRGAVLRANRYFW